MYTGLDYLEARGDLASMLVTWVMGLSVGVIGDTKWTNRASKSVVRLHH